MDEIIIKEHELRVNIAKLMNDSDLPAIIKIPIIEDTYNQLVTLKDKQYNAAKLRIVAKEEKADGESKKNRVCK